MMKACNRFSQLLLWFIFITLLPVFWAQKVEVLSQVTGYVGHDVTLPCSFIQGKESSNVTQSQWDFLSTDGNKTLIMVFNKQHGKGVHESQLKGRVDMDDQSLQIKNVEFSDAGSYICIINTYPLGTFHDTTQLHVQENSSGCSAGCIAGIVVGCLVVVVAASAGGYSVYNKRHNRKHDPPPCRAEQNNVYEEMSSFHRNVVTGKPQEKTNFLRYLESESDT